MTAYLYPPNELSMQHILDVQQRRSRVVHEAYRLLNIIAADEAPAEAEIQRGEFHLDSLAVEFPNLSESQMAHKLAERLQFNPRRGFWARLLRLFTGAA